MKRTVLSLAAILAVGFAAPASASAWRTVATASDASDYATFAYLTKTVRNAYGLRVRVKAPRGRTKVSGSVFCTNEDFDLETRTFGFSYRSSGQTKTRRLPLPLLDAECDVSVSATGKGGRLTLKLQRD